MVGQVERGPAAGRVVVVGAGLAGLRAAEGLRRAGWTGEVVMVGDEPVPAYQRPPLSKQLLAGAVEPEALAVRPVRAARDLTWLLGRTVRRADLDARTVTLDDGQQQAWDGLVVASGLRAVRLDMPGPRQGRHVLRTLADAQALRRDLVPGARLVVVGAGLVGCEVAATARALGVEVHVVAPEPVLLERVLGPELGAALTRRHEAEGVHLHLGRTPVAYRGTAGGAAGHGDGRGGADRVASVVLSDGQELPADAVLEAVGSRPCVEWLDGADPSGRLDLADGVACDAELRVAGRPDVVACGDVARLPGAGRVEHWTNATDTGRRAGAVLAAHLLGTPAPAQAFAPVPSFWSDQYDLALQAFGNPALGTADVRVLEGELSAGPGAQVAVGYHADGGLVGVVLVGLAARHVAYRDALTSAPAGPRA